MRITRAAAAACLLCLSSGIVANDLPTAFDTASNHLDTHAPPEQQSRFHPRAAPAGGARANGRKRPPKEWKYFHEAGTSAAMSHYDGQYFQGEVPYKDHRLVLRHLIRSYLTAFRVLGFETWLAHGTLLGWWWNGKILPWDSDIDTQVSLETLDMLAKGYNRTFHEYHYVATVGADGKEVDTKTQGVVLEKEKWHEVERNRTYVLDINPNYQERKKISGRNVIDARWIDTSTGVFIDITAVAERDPKRSPGLWACKNNHRYRTADLWPMRETDFEGVPATVPRAFDTILTGEYGKQSLVMREWEGHAWDIAASDWIRIPYGDIL